MRASVDRERRLVRAGLLGFIGDGLAVARPGTGCAAIPDGDLELAAPDSRGGAPEAGASASAADADAFCRMEMPSRQMRRSVVCSPTTRSPGQACALVVLKRGRIVAERRHGGFRAGTTVGASRRRVWSYSSGTANILSRMAQGAAGTLVGSSYMYASARYPVAMSP